MINYEVRLERCKREDKKELIIQCLDKASIDHRNEMHQQDIYVLEVFGFVVISIILGVIILNRIFK